MPSLNEQISVLTALQKMVKENVLPRFELRRMRLLSTLTTKMAW